SLKWDGVVGTIAGENTIFILMRTEDMAHKLNDKLKQYIK
ncbi:MAG: arginine repressor, partial [Oscillospiraceae bacterium]|nr:arginine repressor [Oscillospiraceae bacterium]